MMTIRHILLFVATASASLSPLPALPQITELARFPLDVGAGRKLARQADAALSCYADPQSTGVWDACQSSVNSWYTAQSSCAYADDASALACDCHYITEIWECDTAFCPNLPTASVTGEVSTLRSVAALCSSAAGAPSLTEAPRTTNPVASTSAVRTSSVSAPAAATTSKVTTTSRASNITASTTGPVRVSGAERSQLHGSGVTFGLCAVVSVCIGLFGALSI